MVNFDKIYCFFEKSGTFKNEFIKKGYKAFDVDIKYTSNVDYCCDLFSEIIRAYRCETSIFDTITENDLILAFFPCIRFTQRMNPMYKMRRGLDDISMLERNVRFMDETANLYSVFNKLFIVCARRNLKLVVENPYRADGFLARYFAFEPDYIDFNRCLHGDNFEKPTQFFFYGFKPELNIDFLCVENVIVKRIVNCSTLQRSLITSVYASWFIDNLLGVKSSEKEN